MPEVSVTTTVSRGPTLTQTKATTTASTSTSTSSFGVFHNPAAYSYHYPLRALESPSLSSALRLSQ